MISAGDFRNGVTVEIDGNVCQIVEFQHVKPGKGAAFVRTKYKNIITGSVLQRNSLQHVLSVLICSICTMTADYTTS